VPDLALASAAHQVGALLIWLGATQFVRSWPSAAHLVGALLIWFRATHEVRALTRRVCCHVSLLPAMLRSATYRSLGVAGNLSDEHRVTTGTSNESRPRTSWDGARLPGWAHLAGSTRAPVK
jgi:hypothetical protein